MAEFDTAIIGAGSAGITVAIGLAGFGKKIALIERDFVGGDCTNVGCIPSKTLIHLSQQLTTRTPEDILAKVRKHVEQLRDEEDEWLASTEHVSLFRAEASFVDAHTLKLTQKDGLSEHIKAKHIVIASGSRAITIPIAGLPKEKMLTNESLFDLDHPPKHLAIIGAGIIGCEMAFAFERLGTKISLIDLASRTLSVHEPEVSELIKTKLEERGIEVYLNSKASAFDNDSQTLFLDNDGEEIALQNIDNVLIAIGRKPNLELNLEAAGVSYDKWGIKTNKIHQTNLPHIFAIGDVDPSSAFTHSANAQGRRVVQKIALPVMPLSKEPIYPSATFTSPEIAQVGPRLMDLQKQFHPKLIFSQTLPLNETDRGYTQFMDERDGFVRIHAMRVSGRVLSATIVAPGASEMIGLLSYAVNNRVRLYQLSSLVFPYPVLSAAIKKVADNFVFTTLPALRKELMNYIRYRWHAGRT